MSGKVSPPSHEPADNVRAQLERFLLAPDDVHLTRLSTGRLLVGTAAKSIVVAPQPQPTSITRSPGFGAATAMSRSETGPRT